MSEKQNKNKKQSLNAAEDVQQLELSYSAGRNVIGTTTLKNCWQVSTLPEHTYTLRPKNRLPGTFPSEIK